MTKIVIPKPISEGEAALAIQLTSMRIPFEREVVFAPPRKWRFDFVLVGKLAVEVEGGVYSGGRHTRGSGFVKDMLKYNEATRRGYRLLRFSTQMVVRGEALQFIELVLKG